MLAGVREVNVAPVFLTADWRYLVMANYEVEPERLEPFAPVGTSLDRWHGRYYVSLVAFRFLNTRVLGISIPGHRDFDEINLRFYVRREIAGEVRRGVVFIKEVVPRWAIAAVARWIYNENYIACPTTSDVALPSDNDEATLCYTWKPRGAEPITAQATIAGQAAVARQGSEEQFIAEHYWGYARQRDGSTVEYRVEHEPWKVWRARGWHLSGSFADFYGERFAPVLASAPSSVFVAAGSPVTVRRGVPMTD